MMKTARRFTRDIISYNLAYIRARINNLDSIGLDLGTTKMKIKIEN